MHSNKSSKSGISKIFGKYSTNYIYAKSTQISELRQNVLNN